MAQRQERTIPSGGPTPPPPGTPITGGAPTSTRERILDVALDLFVRKGYTETSLREIAAELGVSKAALYYHFESKQDILAALHLRLHSLTDGLLPLLQAEPNAGDIWERLVDHLIGLVLQNRRLIELHLRNQEAIAEVHHATAQEKHGPQIELQSLMQGMLSDPSIPVMKRVRRMAALGAIAGVLLATGTFADVTQADLEGAIRGVVHDVLDGHAAV